MSFILCDGLLALGGLAWFHWNRVELPLKTVRGRLRDLLLAALCGTALTLYILSGPSPLKGQIHVHEWVHYYLGAKYTSELSYDRLYECIDVADAEDGMRATVERRRTTDLGTNRETGAREILAHPELCTAHFTPQRWSQFQHDVRYFRGRAGAAEWNEILVDHGYNGTPVWATAAGAVANLSPATDSQVLLLSLLDPLYFLAMAAAVGWAFGWRVSALGILVLTTYLPAGSAWTGGAFLRWDWLFYTVAAVACLKKRRALPAGLALGYAASLRVFPAVLFLAPAAQLLWTGLAHRRRDRFLSRFVLSGLASAAVLNSAGVLIYGARDYGAFAHNLAKTAGTPFTNSIGLSTLLRWRPGQTMGALYDPAAADPVGAWRQALIAATTQMAPILAACCLAFVAALLFTARAEPPWVAAALGVAVLPLTISLMGYYYMVVIVVALLSADHRRAGVSAWLLGLCAVSDYIGLAPLRIMPRWLDEQYILISAATIAVFVLVLSPRRGRRRRPAPLPAALSLAEPLADHCDL